jgi:D-alanyl-D-alanine carboxypeptidase/lipoprotein-anchoring transpeptidase ErfK/SrfK
VAVGEHTFDWRGFHFSATMAAAVVLLCIAGHFVSLYANGYFNPLPSAAASVQTEPLVPAASALALSTTTPERVINALTIREVVPPSGKFIAADLVHMQLYLFQDGVATSSFPILTKGKPGTAYETPGGMYAVLYKEKEHINGFEHVHMPYSMEFYGNYYIHGWPTYDDGTPVASTYSGGCIRLSTDDAKQVYAFAGQGTRVFVYDPGAATASAPLLLQADAPAISARSYLVADADTGDVYAQKDISTVRPIASVTKLMTALVANETIMFDHKITVPRGELADAAVATDTEPETFVVGDLLYPLLLESNNNTADTLAKYYGTGAFVQWMNEEAQALDMASTTFADASGVSAQDTSTPEDLYRLAVYLANKKSFVWGITRTPSKTITAGSGSKYTFANFNIFSAVPSFVGGKVGHTTPAQDTMVSLFAFPKGDTVRRVVVVVLDSDNYALDTAALADWFDQSAVAAANTACVSCAAPPSYPKIQL